MYEAYPRPEKHLVPVHNNRAVKCADSRGCDAHHAAFDL